MKEAKIVLFDIETLPNPFEAIKVWPSLGNFPGLTLRGSINSVLCFGYGIFGEKSIKCLTNWDYPGWKKNVNDDFELVRDLRAILSDADAVVTHNGKRFDWKFIQTRFVYHGLTPLPKIPHVDTKALASSNLFFFSNKLDLLAESLKLGRKLDHEGWELWVKVFRRDPVAMAKMKKYCAQDVEVLKQLFCKLRPFASNLPNQNLFGAKSGDKPLCPNCGSTRLKSEGIRSTKTRVYRRLNCIDCGSWSTTDLKDKNPRSI